MPCRLCKHVTLTGSKKNGEIVFSGYMDVTTFYILTIIFIATLVRSTFGFGESLIAVPLLILLIPIEIAVPLSVLISILIAAFVVVQDRKQIHFHSAKWLLIFAALGIPPGIVILLYGDENLIKCGLGLLIILYALYALSAKTVFGYIQTINYGCSSVVFCPGYSVEPTVSMARRLLFMAICAIGRQSISGLRCKPTFYPPVFWE